MNNDFLLTNDLSKEIYSVIANMPIIDFHNHLNINHLSNDHKFNNITELWLQSDPYKHRAMRILGVDEELITGKLTSDLDKFRVWSQTLPQLLGNPLFDWSKMELQILFNISEPLNINSSDYIYKEINSQLANDNFSTLNILKRFNIEYMAPCVEVNDNFDIFKNLKNIVPSLRGDNFVLPSKEFLFECGEVTSLDDYKDFLIKKIDNLHQVGCRVADHAIDYGFCYHEDSSKADNIFLKIYNNNDLDNDEKNILTSDILRFVSGEYARRNWLLQLHIGALRYTSSKLRKRCGAAGGFAGISSVLDVAMIAKFLDDLESNSTIPKTILFTLNPTYRVPLAVLSGSFPNVQLGPAWWYCDHIHGMREVLDTIANYGLLAKFIGMTTDSRSVASFVRHDYFRRTFSVYLSEKIINKTLPNDIEAIKSLAVQMSYTNAKIIKEL